MMIEMTSGTKVIAMKLAEGVTAAMAESNGRFLIVELCRHDSHTMGGTVPLPVARSRLGQCTVGGTMKRNVTMLWTIAVILVVLWLLGMTTSYTFSASIHLLLVLAIMIVLARVIQGRRMVN